MSHRTEQAAQRPVADSFAWISWLRVVAIGAVVLIHTTAATAGSADAQSTAHGWLAVALDYFSRWAVPVFVMLSGALLLDPDRYRGNADFLRRRAMRLVPAVVFWHLVYLIYLIVARDDGLTVHKVIALTLTGRLFTALYFFWIILGLAVITPLLIPWIAGASARTRIIVGACLCAVPALSIITAPLRGLDWHADVAWVETPWTWFIPYLGYYVLGFALRGVVLRGRRLALAAALAIGGCVLLTWQRNQTVGFGGWLERHSPAQAYYGPIVIVIAICIFLCAHALIRPDGPLRVMCNDGATRLGRRLGDATLGVFGVHLLVLQFMYKLPKVGGDFAAGSVQQLLARCVFVFVVAYVISLVAAKIPVVRKVF